MSVPSSHQPHKGVHKGVGGVSISLNSLLTIIFFPFSAYFLSDVLSVIPKERLLLGSCALLVSIINVSSMHSKKITAIQVGYVCQISTFRRRFLPTTLVGVLFF